MTLWKGAALIFLTLAPSAPAMAQSLRVTAGDHEGFTRVVVQGPAIGYWAIGRTAEGYGLRLAGSPRYDLTRVFRLIGRNRLSAVWPDPDGDLLRMRVACACHAMAFLDGPDVLVIDLKDGAAPDDSPFEFALQSGDLPDLQASDPMRPRPRPESLAVVGPGWAGVVLAAIRLAPEASFQVPSQDGKQRANAGGALRMALTEELAKGAARGIVDLARPRQNGPPSDAALPPGLGSRLALLPGVTTILSPDAPMPLTATGAPCIGDDRLAIASWGVDSPVWQQMAETTAVPGEFDKTDVDVRDRAIRRLLYLGFGLEAQRLIEAVPVDAAARGNEAAYLAMAQILDGEEVESTVFQDAATCDGAVALWAVLAERELPAFPLANTAAVRRTFSALPPHLRQLLGPRLVAQLLASDEQAAASDVQAAMQRPGGAVPPEVAASAAGIAMRSNDPQAALAALADAPSTGPGAVESLVAQVEALVAMGQSVPPGMATALAALRPEYQGTTIEVELRRALVLAEAASGDFDAAMAALPAAPEAADRVFSLLAMADDETLLTHAAAPAEDSAMNVSGATRGALARRLVDLGLGLPALAWLGDETEDPMLASRAALLSGDARAALTHLAGGSGQEAAALRRSARAQLLRPGLEAVGASDGSDPQLAIWLSDWTWVAAHGSEPWRSAAGLAVGPEETMPAGALAQADALLERAATTRSAVRALLATVERSD